MNFFQRHMTLKGRIVLFLEAFFTALLFCQNAAENSVTGWLVTDFKDSGILTAAGLGTGMAADILLYAGMLALTGLLCLRDKH